MTVSYKRLAQIKPSAGNKVLAYASPSNTQIESINITNLSNTPTTYSIALNNSGTVSYAFSWSDFSTQNFSISTDGISWNQINTGSNTIGQTSIAYGNGLYITASQVVNSTFLSTDGINFNYADPYSGTHVAFGNGVFVVLNGSPIHSTDGHTWTYSSVGFISGSLNIYSFQFVNNYFILSGSDYTGQSYVVYSTDGINWSYNIAPTVADVVVYGNGRYVFAGWSETSQLTQDFIDWMPISISYNYPYVNQMVFGNGIFSAYIPSLGIYSSTDAVNWIFTGINPDPSNSGMIWFTDGIFTASGVSNPFNTFVSTDGRTWTQISPIPNFGYYILAGKTISTRQINPYDYIKYNETIPANTTIKIKSGYGLTNNQGIIVSSANGSVSFNIFGAEIKQ